MLSFALYNLLKHPEAMAKLRAEVDEVLGDQPLQVSDLGKFPYLTGTLSLLLFYCQNLYLRQHVGVLRETLRMTPSIPIRSTTPKEDTTLANGRYAVKAGTNILIIHQTAQTDPAAWGEDVSVSLSKVTS
jgi:cytochrome P450/NADPH-cytochrome P450 reductase